jgi:predicted GNAT family acetyltransferase
MRIENDTEQDRYEIYDGDDLAGYTKYRAAPGLIAFLHTEMDPRFEGKGLASQLIRFALEDARSNGLEVLPFCPFVNGYIQRHHEWADLIPASYRRGFEAAGS